MMYLPMKRGRDQGEVHNLANMGNYLMVMSRSQTDSLMNRSPSRLYECKTCSRQFPSFQALGGHRASHKKPRLMGGNLTNHIQADDHESPNSPAPLAKPKTHDCPICGIEFAIGQALGGHMRRHRAAAAIDNHQNSPFTSLNFQRAVEVPVGKMMENGTRVFGLDLNLTPLENKLEFADRDQKLAANMIELCL